MTLRHTSLSLCTLAICWLGGCGTPAERALGIPGGASRTPDLTLPLSDEHRQLAVYYLDGKRPHGGRWRSVARNLEEEMESVDVAAVETKFGALLDALAGSVPVEGDLTAEGGRLGPLFDPAGASDEALDARLRGQIMTGDLLVGLRHDHYFVFYRRFPTTDGDATCDVRGDEPTYCRLVIVAKAATHAR